MFIQIYKVTSPSVIEEFIDCLDYNETTPLVKVDTMAICKADIRYFLGNRSKYILDHKYPLAPIHEAVGEIVKDPTNTFKKGDKVILIPNYVNHNFCQDCNHKRCHDNELGENYCPYAKFKSSSSDGFMRSFYACTPDLLVKYDSSISPSIAVWSELLSVSNAACRRIDMKNVQDIALFGDGIMGYMVYILLTKKYKKNVTVFGIDDKKLSMFKDAKIAKFEEYHGKTFDTLIEAVGGKPSEYAINNMIDISSIGADLILMGVSEEGVTINTRKVLEKGLSLKGVTRSSREYFEEVAKLICQKDVQEDIIPLILSYETINSVNDIYRHFELDINNKTSIGKHIMKF